MMDDKSLNDWLRNETNVCCVKIDDLGSGLAKKFINTYMTQVGSNLEFDDFRNFTNTSGRMARLL